ncbi:MAG: DUF1080 domain-containing protein [Acidobacteria bacterium]|nr:DUF1080 domain-containing protein [Acidobacteriota bacterium]
MLCLEGQTLFDGRTSAGWQTLMRETFPAAAWRIEDGALCSIATGPRADLSSVKKFRNFELEFDWWIEKGTNSGVKYLVFGTRANPDTGKLDPDVPKALGFELQLIDDERVPDAKVSRSRGTGALYLFAEPGKLPALAVEQWHKEMDLESAKLREAMVAEKRADIPKPYHLDELKEHPEKAYPLVLTHHGGKGCYRNIRIRE